jgi:hypothetical protein
MSRRFLIGGAVLAFLVAAAVSGTLPASITGETTERVQDWSLNMTAIEACSCPMFCQCYFNTEPAAHHHHDHGDAEHYCRFNIAWQVNHGHHGGTDLTGARFWMAGDLGSDWEDGRMDWSVLHFDPGVSPEQREGILEIVGPLFPVEWASFEIGEELPIEWRAEGDRAVATLDGGHAAEVRLVRVAQRMSDHPVVLDNVQYWGAPRHDGFVLMPNEVEAYRLGPNAFEYEGTNGFMITIDINSDDVATR